MRSGKFPQGGSGEFGVGGSRREPLAASDSTAPPYIEPV